MWWVLLFWLWVSEDSMKDFRVWRELGLGTNGYIENLMGGQFWEIRIFCHHWQNGIPPDSLQVVGVELGDWADARGFAWSSQRSAAISVQASFDVEAEMKWYYPIPDLWMNRGALGSVFTLTVGYEGRPCSSQLQWVILTGLNMGCLHAPVRNLSWSWHGILLIVYLILLIQDFVVLFESEIGL